MIARSVRRGLLVLVFALATAGCAKAPAEGEASATPALVTLRIGYQKSGAALALLKWRSTLEPALAELKVKLEWAEFSNGPALLEALNAEQLDFGFVGEAPPIFAQAASARMVYLATEPAAPQSEALLVRADSPLRLVSDLRGRSVALNKGSNVQFFLVRALEQAGLAYPDVKVVYLPPADARAAFERGSVDAWAIWDPYLASVQASLSPRVLSTGEGVAPNQQFYVGRRDFVEQHPSLVEVVLQNLRATDAWLSEHGAEATGYLATQLSLEPAAAALWLGRTKFGVLPINEDALENQQRIADAFLRLGLLPQSLRVRDALTKAKVLP
jgi:sulfonate transport system substrate-binding protein